MSDFLLGLFEGHYLGNQPQNPIQKDTLGISKEQILEHIQTHVLIEIVTAADRVEKRNPSPSELKLQLQPLRIIFNRIDTSVIKSSDGRTVYQQVKEYFEENGVV